MGAELTDMERAYVGQALYKRVAEEMSTGNPDNLRGRADAELRRRYEETGAKSYDAILFGRKVGTWSVNVSNGAPERIEEVLSVRDWGAFRQWMELNPDDVLEYVAQEAAVDFCEWNVARTGELPDGARVGHVRITAQSPSVRSTTPRIDPGEVAEAIRDNLPGGDRIAGVLEAGV